MGRFNDLWASGKFALQRNQEADQSRMQEARERAMELSPDLAVAPESREIFDALKAKRGQETGRWLNGLVPAAVEKPMETHATEANAFDEVTKWIDSLCEQFVEISYEFNKRAVGTNLYVSYEKPRMHEKRDEDVWYRPVDKSYKGRLTTRDWALIVRGHESKVAVFVMPSSMVMAFDTDTVGEDEVPPFMEIVRTAAGGKVSWVIGGESTGIEAIPPLAKELFGDLIRVSSGVMSETELFGSHDHPKLGENVAVGYEPAKAPTASDTIGQSAEHVISKACDIVDDIIEEELKKLYAGATSYLPGSPEAAIVRNQISATESFHNKILDAFKEYAHATLEHHTDEKPVVNSLT